jgi:hypothetical protein
MISAVNFITDIELIFGSLTNRITSWKATANDYNFTKANEKSRLIIEFSVLHEQEEPGSFLSTRTNCDYLLKVVKKYIIPNLIKVSEPKSNP